MGSSFDPEFPEIYFLEMDFSCRKLTSPAEMKKKISSMYELF